MTLYSYYSTFLWSSFLSYGIHIAYNLWSFLSIGSTFHPGGIISRLVLPWLSKAVALKSASNLGLISSGPFTHPLTLTESLLCAKYCGSTYISQQFCSISASGGENVWNYNIRKINKCHVRGSKKQLTPISSDLGRLDREWHLSWMLNGTATLGNSLAFLPGVNMELLRDPAILLLGIYPEEMKTYICTNTFRWMFMADLLIIGKKRKHLNVHQMMNG